MLPRKPPRAYIAQSIQALIRSFPSETVTIIRETATYGPGGLRGTPVRKTIYFGEALFAEAGQRMDIIPQGLAPVDVPCLLIPGNRTIRQGDRVTMHGEKYEVTDSTNRWHAFVIAKLRQTEA